MLFSMESEFLNVRHNLIRPKIILINRTQNKLILKNMQLCFSLNGAYYFFGHNADTAIGQARYSTWWLRVLKINFFSTAQEEETGFITGLGDYIMANAPYASDMKPAEYEDYYKAPWATSREFEDKHKRICSEVGASLKGFHFFKLNF